MSRLEPQASSRIVSAGSSERPSRGFVGGALALCGERSGKIEEAPPYRGILNRVIGLNQFDCFAAVHRIGDLDIGDLAVVVAVSCPHRAEAFDACRALIDELKATVPIWKHQRFADGTSEWVGSA